MNYANCHFPGIYSIVLGKSPRGGLSRMFIAEPGALHADLQDFSARFLWHAHSYDLHETAVEGSIENYCVRPGNQFSMYRYDFLRGGPGAPPAIKMTGRVSMEMFASCEIPQGGSYYLAADVIHRVVFRPGSSGWFGARVEESEPRDRPNEVYSLHAMTSFPHGDADLYCPISDDHANDVVRRFHGRTS